MAVPVALPLSFGRLPRSNPSLPTFSESALQHFLYFPDFVTVIPLERCAPEYPNTEIKTSGSGCSPLKLSNLPKKWEGLRVSSVQSEVQKLKLFAQDA